MYLPENFLLTSQTIPSVALVVAWLCIMHSLRHVGWSLAFIGLLGTSLHELTHYICGLILGAKPVSVSLIPKRQGDTWILGSVGFVNLNIWNSAFVAFAPLLLIGVAWLMFEYWLYPAFLDCNYLNWLLAGYVVACSLYSSLPSTTDIRIGALSAIMWGSIGYGIWQVNLWRMPI